MCGTHVLTEIILHIISLYSILFALILPTEHVESTAEINQSTNHLIN